MPDLTIKPNAGSGNKVIIQDQAGGAVLTTADSGATIANASLTAPALGTPTSGALTNCTFPGKLLASVQTFSSAGTATWSKPAGITAVLVYVTGGGGSGGKHGCGSNKSSRSAGGGAGGTAIKWITSGLGSTETVTIGAGGAAVTGDAAGNGGGTSSFGSHCSATGGNGGQQGCAGAVEGGANGVGSNGTINLEGGPGENGAEPDHHSNHLKSSGGNGGESYWGGGGRASTGFDTSVVSEAGVIGSGGGGGHSNQNGFASGAGGVGYCVVWEYK